MGNGNNKTGLDTFLQGLAAVVILILASMLALGDGVSQTMAWIFAAIGAVILAIVVFKVFTLKRGSPGMNTFLSAVAAIVLLILAGWIGMGNVVTATVATIFVIIAAITLAVVVFRVFTRN